MPIKYGDEFSWPVESHTLEAMPVAGRMDGLLGLGQTHTPGSSEVESALYNVADMGLPRGVVISALGGRGKNLNPTHLVQSLPRPPFHSSDICSFFLF